MVVVVLKHMYLYILLIWFLGNFIFFLLPGFKDAVVTCDMLKASENNDPSS